MHPQKNWKSQKPPWLKVRIPSDANFFSVSSLLKTKNLHTICQSGKCPNISECFSHKIAAFLILGDICTRKCAFCAVEKGIPVPPPTEEIAQVAEAVALMGLRYVVVTSVTRDDLPDGGASHFKATIQAIREQTPGVKIEVLVPDFKGNNQALKTVIQARPDILNHNLEVPEAFYPLINRPKKNYQRSLKVLREAKLMGANTKSGLMIGLGEDEKDILLSFSDLRKVSCDLLTIGQYLQPTKSHVPVKKYYTPREFESFKNIALDFGFKAVESGPLVRSSYRAHQMYETLHKINAD